jgi:hypothetical protein
MSKRKPRKRSQVATRTITSTEAVPPLQRRCGTMQVHMWLLEKNPEFRVRQGELERATTQRLRLGARAFTRMTPYRMSVVVHVVYNTDVDNVGDAQVQSQIDALNRDYRLQNADKSATPSVWAGLATDAMIEFHLAEQDPAGIAHSGITRTKTESLQFEDDDKVKSSATGGVDPWPTAKYLNIWVCKLGGGLLGYAQFPGGPSGPLLKFAPHLGRYRRLHWKRLRRRYPAGPASELWKTHFSAHFL